MSLINAQNNPHQGSNVPKNQESTRSSPLYDGTGKKMQQSILSWPPTPPRVTPALTMDYKESEEEWILTY